jgi:hypothetical protein
MDHHPKRADPPNTLDAKYMRLATTRGKSIARITAWLLDRQKREFAESA